MAAEKTYNGFTNYETWAVGLWLSNDIHHYQYFRNLAEAVHKKHVTVAGRDSREELLIELAEQLRDEIERGSPVRKHATIYADLMSAALSAVNWHELATELLEEIERRPT